MLSSLERRGGEFHLHLAPGGRIVGGEDDGRPLERNDGGCTRTGLADHRLRRRWVLERAAPPSRKTEREFVVDLMGRVAIEIYADVDVRELFGISGCRG